MRNETFWKCAVVIIILLLCTLCIGIAMLRNMVYTAQHPDYSEYGPAELSNVIDAKQEQISELEDEIAYLQKLHAEKLK